MKKVLITGASEGIGKAIALRLATEDMSLMLLARNEEKLEAVKKEVEVLGGNAHVVVCDMRSQEAVVAVADTLTEIDVLINNAGIWHKMSQLDEITPDTISDVIATNLTGQITLTNQLLPKLRNSATPAVLNIISKSGVTAQEGQTVYTASKWGMKGFTDTLRNDVRDTNIRVGAVYQAGTATDMFEKTGEEVPREKFTPPEDLAETIAFMLTRPDKIWLNEVHVTY